MTSHTTAEERSRFRLMLRYWVAVAIVAIAVVLVGCGSGTTTTTEAPDGTATTGAGGSSGGATAQVNMQGLAFDPQTMTINVGDTVNWTNRDEAPHNAVADDKSWKTSVFATGESGSVTFTTAGTFPYICTIHPNMTGTVIVQ